MDSTPEGSLPQLSDLMRINVRAYLSNQIGQLPSPPSWLSSEAMEASCYAKCNLNITEYRRHVNIAAAGIAFIKTQQIVAAPTSDIHSHQPAPGPQQYLSDPLPAPEPTCLPFRFSWLCALSMTPEQTAKVMHESAETERQPIDPTRHTATVAKWKDMHHLVLELRRTLIQLIPCYTSEQEFQDMLLRPTIGFMTEYLVISLYVQIEQGVLCRFGEADASQLLPMISVAEWIDAELDVARNRLQAGSATVRPVPLLSKKRYTTLVGDYQSEARAASTEFISTDDSMDVDVPPPPHLLPPPTPLHLAQLGHNDNNNEDRMDVDWPAPQDQDIDGIDPRLWWAHHVQMVYLTKPMRDRDDAGWSEFVDLAGTTPPPPNTDPGNHFEIPLTLDGFKHTTSVDEAIHFVYPELRDCHGDLGGVADVHERAIMCFHNAHVNEINTTILERVPGAAVKLQAAY
ncbi:hypothetical protein BCR44DRAFT_1542112 [Catenaria anguillulae PL171]|uniref:Uncharacterized protein n=1 Tax=Catenaria anguillulae PL171 TaxID=765915 RepID=A0A1Y2H7G8_9FUNG|nr:hypothetical protein BCR44DRAFT_1542112 [Catenaria anguillulae PL171]